MKHIVFVGSIVVLAAAIAGATLLPISTIRSPEIPLPISRMLSCPVGDAYLGSTKITITDRELFTVGIVGGLPSDPAMFAAFEDPESPIIVRGSATVGGISIYSESDRSMMVPCAPPISTGTWNGVMTATSESTLILTNVDIASAVVDVFLYDQTGPIPLPGLRDIPVGAGVTQLLSIHQLVSIESPISVQLRASKGRVAAVMRVMNSTGWDWELPQTSADTDLIISGIPAGEGTRTLSITNPDQAKKVEIKVEVIGETGPFTPLGLESIEIPPARTISVDVSQALGGQPSAVHLIADRPITATVTIEGQDMVGISAAPPLHGAVVLPAVGGTLWAVNPDNAMAFVTLEVEDENGSRASTVAQIPGKTLVPIPYPSTGKSVMISTPSEYVRTSLVIQDKSWSVLPISGGGIVTAVDAPRLDPGLG
ncbi:MAG: DUF5719 family protein [Propionibacteriaceae bacterium]|nr:DUF5719 family protein [Propionibacteriaceae bacterium]